MTGWRRGTAQPGRMRPPGRDGTDAAMEPTPRWKRRDQSRRGRRSYRSAVRRSMVGAASRPRWDRRRDGTDVAITHWHNECLRSPQRRKHARFLPHDGTIRHPSGSIPCVASPQHGGIAPPGGIETRRGHKSADQSRGLSRAWDLARSIHKGVIQCGLIIRSCCVRESSGVRLPPIRWAAAGNGGVCGDRDGSGVDQAAQRPSRGCRQKSSSHRLLLTPSLANIPLRAYASRKGGVGPACFVSHSQPR